MTDRTGPTLVTPEPYPYLSQKRWLGFKLCKECGCPILKKGQTRNHPDEYRHASGCPLDDCKDQTDERNLPLLPRVERVAAGYRRAAMSEPTFDAIVDDDIWDDAELRKLWKGVDQADPVSVYACGRDDLARIVLAWLESGDAAYCDQRQRFADELRRRVGK